MRLLVCGDVVGRSGRTVVLENIPRLREELALDFVIVNGENAAGGFGITPKICDAFFAAGVDVITTGNHVWDQREIIPHIAGDARLLRPINYPEGTPGRGAQIVRLADGREALVVNVMCRLFMDALDDPFAALERVLAPYPLGARVAAVLIDVHGEATSEKMALGHAFDGRASLVVGTHSHVPTSDYRILAAGTAYQSDAGMCGDYDSVIGMKKQAAVERFKHKMPGERLTPAEGEGTLCGVLVETDARTGLARSIAPVVLGGRLARQWPDGAEAPALLAEPAGG